MGGRTALASDLQRARIVQRGVWVWSPGQRFLFLHVTQAGLEFTPFCLSLLNASITDMCYWAHLESFLMKITSGESPHGHYLHTGLLDTHIPSHRTSRGPPRSDPRCEGERGQRWTRSTLAPGNQGRRRTKQRARGQEGGGPGRGGVLGARRSSALQREYPVCLRGSSKRRWPWSLW